MPHPHAHVNPPPHHTKRFHVEDMRRIPVRQDDEAKVLLDRTSHQARVLPQALGEFFGTLPEVSHVKIGLEGDLLAILVRHREREDRHYRFCINVEDMQQGSFDAALLTDELLRLYRVHVLREEEVQ